MQVRDVLPGIENKYLLIDPKIRTIDKNGRIYLGVDHAHKKGLLLFVEVREEELEKPHQ